MEALLVSLLLWINAHGFAACVGLPEVKRVSISRTHGYMAWYQDGVINLSGRFDYDGLFADGSDRRITLARSALVHELIHYRQEQREGPRRIAEYVWLERED